MTPSRILTGSSISSARATWFITRADADTLAGPRAGDITQPRLELWASGAPVHQHRLRSARSAVFGLFRSFPGRPGRPIQPRERRPCLEPDRPGAASPAPVRSEWRAIKRPASGFSAFLTGSERRTTRSGLLAAWLASPPARSWFVAVSTAKSAWQGDPDRDEPVRAAAVMCQGAAAGPGSAFGDAAQPPA